MLDVEEQCEILIEAGHIFEADAVVRLVLFVLGFVPFVHFHLPRD